MAEKIVIGCKLPHGLILEYPGKPEITVELAGLNKTRIIGSECAFTDVDADFWSAWKSKNKEFPALLSKAIFEAKSIAEAESKAVEFAGEKTGFEPLAQNEGGVKAATLG